MPVAVERPVALVELATEHDLPQVAEVFADAFAESVRHVYGRPANPPALTEIFRLCLAAEPEAFFVARDGARVTGYCFAPQRVRRLWSAFFSRGFAGRWLLLLVTGRFGVGWREIGRLLPDKLSFLSTATRANLGGDARILSVGVRTEDQGKGIGRALLQQALDRFDRLGEPLVQLEVRPWNEPALRLYLRYGFVETGRSRDSQGEWIVMSRRRG